MTEEKKEKKPRADVLNIARHIARTIAGDYPSESFAPFPEKYHILKDPNGSREIIREHDDGVITYKSKNAVLSAVIAYIDNSPLVAEKMQVNDFDAIVKYWQYSSPPFSHKILPVLQKSQLGYTFHRLPFDFEFQREPVTWNELLNRMSNNTAFMAWVGSLFDPNSNRHQYCWLHGVGNNGKSSIGRFLTRVLEKTTTWQQVPKDNRFWTAGLLGKRLVIFGDCNNYHFPTTGLFKSLTGGDAIRIERKNQAEFSAYLDCKFLFFSNEEPQLESKEADLRRAIFCRLDPLKENSPLIPDYEDRLWAEAPSFLHRCMEEYSKVSNLQAIPCDKSDLLEIAAIAEDRFDYIFERNFEACLLEVADIANPNYMTASEVCRLLRSDGIVTNHEQGKFHKWMQVKYKVSKGHATLKGRDTRIFRGIRNRILSDYNAKV